jgi:hypothetical protein
VCPESIRITDNAIIPLKERVGDDFYDPVRWLLKKVAGGPQKKKASLPIFDAIPWPGRRPRRPSQAQGRVGR